MVLRLILVILEISLMVMRPHSRNDTETFAVRPNGLDVIRQGLVLATMTLVFIRVFQKVAVELLDMIFRQVDDIPTRKNHLHDLGVTGNFLFVPRCEGFDLNVREKLRNFPV